MRDERRHDAALAFDALAHGGRVDGARFGHRDVRRALGSLDQSLRILLGAPPTEELLVRARRLFALVLDAPGRLRIRKSSGGRLT